MQLLDIAFIRNQYFRSLSANGSRHAMLHLLSPARQSIEGTGFFNDFDFLNEACRNLGGRYNVALCDKGLAAGAAPPQNAYNRFDRLLKNPDPGGLSPHSLTIIFHFKAPMLKEMHGMAPEEAAELGIQGIFPLLERAGLAPGISDYYGLGLAVRFRPEAALGRLAAGESDSRSLLAAVMGHFEKVLYPEESRRYQLTSPELLPYFAPLPGRPWFPAEDSEQGLPVLSMGHWDPACDAYFCGMLDAMKPGAKAHAAYAEVKSLEGLSQNWTDEESGVDIPFGAVREVGKPVQEPPAGSPTRTAHAATGKDSPPHLDRRSEELATSLDFISAQNWGWPLPISGFVEKLGNIAPGELLGMGTPGRHLEMGFQFLCHLVDPFAKQSGAAVVVLSKRRSPGDLLLSALGRHFGRRIHPYPGTGHPFPATEKLMEAFHGSYPRPPKIYSLQEHESLSELVTHMEHARRELENGGGGHPIPVVFLIDSLTDLEPSLSSSLDGRLTGLRQRLLGLGACMAILCASESTHLDALTRVADYFLDVEPDSDSGTGRSTEGEETRLLVKISSQRMSPILQAAYRWHPLWLGVRPL